jgi:hypothetical protein
MGGFKAAQNSDCGKAIAIFSYVYVEDQEQKLEKTCSLSEKLV